MTHPKDIIKRDLYLEKVKPYIDKEIIKVFIGQRRVGKSYLLYQVMQSITSQNRSAQILYINKELYEFKDIEGYEDLLNFIKNKRNKNKKLYLFIDEIQDIKNFEKALRSLQAEGNIDIYCTGSNAYMLSGELSTLLSGRYIEIRVYGLTYSEFCQFHKQSDSDDTLLKYIKYGGLPYLKNLELEDNVIYDYLRNVYEAILFKDVVTRFSVRNIHFLQSLVEYLADNVGSLYSAKRISEFLKSQKINISVNVILNYLTHLASACLVNRVPRYDIVGKKIFEIGEKVYFEDLGLRHAVTGYHQADIGKVMENIVYHHLSSAGFQVTVGILGKQEIDFIAQKGDQKTYIQVAYLLNDEKTSQREFGNLLAIKDNYPKWVISLDPLIAGNKDGIKHMHLRDFCQGLLKN